MPTVIELFDTFSANLGLYRKEQSGLFVCPLCLRVFTRDQIRSDLSKAHIIPQFLGGKDWTLTCRECNNRVGTEIESQEKERANFNWALSGDGNEITRASVLVRDQHGNLIGAVQADMSAVVSEGERRLQLHLKPRASNPAALNVLADQLSNGVPAGTSAPEVQFRITRDSRRANLTHVHAGYLQMFHQFGYEWALDPCAELIRKQIMSPDEPIISPLFPVLPNHGIPADKMGILLVTQPVNWRHFVVVMPLYRGKRERKGVWMPLFGQPYQQPPREKCEVQVVPVPDHHQLLARPDSYMQGLWFVRNHFRHDPLL
jgi:hypothetical protein